jgi:hypothetical protein
MVVYAARLRGAYMEYLGPFHLDSVHDRFPCRVTVKSANISLLSRHTRIPHFPTTPVTSPLVCLS